MRILKYTSYRNNQGLLNDDEMLEEIQKEHSGTVKQHWVFRSEINPGGEIHV